MNSRNFILLAIAVGIIITFYYLFFSNTTDQDYINGILSERKAKNEFMQSGDDSPIKNDSIQFTGLKYFPPDPRFRILANLEPIRKKVPRTLPTSDDQTQSYLTYAWANFDLAGLHHRLLILEVMEPGPRRGTLFLAFSDETSTKETYGAGRYLDLKKTPGSYTILLDFNKAYNPYCAYSDNYSCPFPPEENNLKIPITAGEMNYH